MDTNNTQIMQESLNVFDDEFAIDDFDFSGNGFAPGRLQHDGNDGMEGLGGSDDDDDDDDEPPIQSVAAHIADLPPPATTQLSPRFAANRSSIRKSRNMDNPFRSVEDDDDGDTPLNRTASIHSQSTAYAPDTHRRSTSSASSFAPYQTTAQAAGGPSHPYAMYPQGTNLARTLSTSTLSTVRAPQRPLMSEEGPTHPYSMYPQNFSEDTDADEEDGAEGEHGAAGLQSQIPVGFPGRQQPAYRRQGPEGEEHDIIGIDGHTEQLPPYSEYPEDGVPKHIVLPGAAVIASATGTTADPAPGAALTAALFQGPPQSMSDAVSRPADSLDPFTTSMHQVESIDSSGPPRWRDKSWRQKKKTRFCGIPFWWLLLSFGVMAFIAVVLGGAIGGFMSAQKRAEEAQSSRSQDSANPAPVTSLVDASPIPTSSSGTPPTTGTYALSLGTPRATQAACLTNQSYAAAWNCDIPSPEAVNIIIQQATSGSSSSEGASVLDTSNFDDYSNYSYGTQAPTTTFSQFISVSDIDDPELGPAFYFSAYYNKLVIIEETALPSDAATVYAKRDPGWTSADLDVWTTRKEIASGSKPWFCFWNGTLLEGFIYSQEKAVTANASSSASSTVFASSATSSVTGSSSSPSSMSSSTFVSTTATTTSAASSPSAASSTVPAFGYVVKIQERRLQNTEAAPYCQQMQILDDGSAGILTDSSGNAVQFNLPETDPSYSAYASAYASASPSSTAVSEYIPGGCLCQWLSGQ